MQNKWFFYFGYRRIQLMACDVRKCVELFRKENIIARFFTDTLVDVSVFSWKKAMKILENNIVFTEQKTGGLFSLFPFLKKQIPILLALFVSLVFYLFVSIFVFDVRVEGNEFLTAENVCEELNEAGLYVGAIWKNLSFSEIEAKLLGSSEDIAWLNIYRRGLVAYVTVKEKERTAEKTEPQGFANIVSNTDGVIEEIFLKNGSSAVVVGQTVKKGDVLISAFDAQGEPTYAQGEVYARVYGSFSVFIPRHETQIVDTKYILMRKTIKFLNFSINIFKNYGNLPQECDIIEDNRRILLSRDKQLPLTFIDAYAVVKEKTEVIHTDEELIALAKSAHEGALLSYLSSGEIVFVKTVGEFTAEGYLMKSEICMLTEIGLTVPLPVE